MTIKTENVIATIIVGYMEKQMTRAFSDTEKEAIKARLIAVGLEMFSVYGLKKTSVDEIAAKAGISKGSFYNFYKSKELLLWDAVKTIEQEIRMEFMSIISGGKMNREGLNTLFLSIFGMIDKYPIIRRLLDADDYQQLVRALPQEIVTEHLAEDDMFSMSFIEALVGMGVRLPGNPGACAAMLRGIFFMVLHEKEIGNNFRQGMELLAGIMADSFKPAGEDNDHS
ncbi:MAG: TetR/AcrR family transcriptional regulator [Spirochaetales bacterium]|nr:TetR/AcrR family transcriptional regulator [Spirochaetales bacterium]